MVFTFEKIGYQRPRLLRSEPGRQNTPGFTLIIQHKTPSEPCIHDGIKPNQSRVNPILTSPGQIPIPFCDLKQEPRPIGAIRPNVVKTRHFLTLAHPAPVRHLSAGHAKNEIGANI